MLFLFSIAAAVVGGGDAPNRCAFVIEGKSASVVSERLEQWMESAEVQVKPVVVPQELRNKVLRLPSAGPDASTIDRLCAAVGSHELDVLVVGATQQQKDRLNLRWTAIDLRHREVLDQGEHLVWRQRRQKGRLWRGGHLREALFGAVYLVSPRASEAQEPRRDQTPGVIPEVDGHTPEGHENGLKTKVALASSESAAQVFELSAAADVRARELNFAQDGGAGLRSYSLWGATGVRATARLFPGAIWSTNPALAAWGLEAAYSEAFGVQTEFPGRVGRLSTLWRNAYVGAVGRMPLGSVELCATAGVEQIEFLFPGHKNDGQILLPETVIQSVRVGLESTLAFEFFWLRATTGGGYGMLSGPLAQAVGSTTAFGLDGSLQAGVRLGAGFEARLGVRYLAVMLDFSTQDDAAFVADAAVDHQAGAHAGLAYVY